MEANISKLKNNNHFVSRFQLRRFLCDPPKNKPGRYFVWVYSADAEPQAKNIQHVGSAAKFYGETDDELENAFGDRESAYGNLFSALEHAPEDMARYGDQLSDLCWLFSFRTRALREKMKGGLASMASRVAESVTAERVYQRLSKRMDDKIQERVTEMTAGLNRQQKRMPDFKKALIVVKNQAHEIISSDEFASYFRHQLELFGLLAKETNEIDNEHNRVLQEMIAVGEHCPEKLKPKKWFPMVSRDGLFVLGDSGAVLATNDGLFSPFIGMGTGADCLFLAINPHLMAVGTFNDELRDWTEDEIIAGTIESSYENFFADRNDRRLEDLAKRFLALKSFVTDAQIDKIVNEFWAR